MPEADPEPVLEPPVTEPTEPLIAVIVPAIGAFSVVASTAAWAASTSWSACSLSAFARARLASALLTATSGFWVWPWFWLVCCWPVVGVGEADASSAASAASSGVVERLLRGGDRVGRRDLVLVGDPELPLGGGRVDLRDRGALGDHLADLHQDLGDRAGGLELRGRGLRALQGATGTDARGHVARATAAVGRVALAAGGSLRKKRK